MEDEGNRIGERILASRPGYICACCATRAQHPIRDQRPIGWWTVTRDYRQLPIHICENCKAAYSWPFDPEVPTTKTPAAGSTAETFGFRPPEELVDALQDRIHPTSGRLPGAKPIKTRKD